MNTITGPKAGYSAGSIGSILAQFWCIKSCGIYAHTSIDNTYKGALISKKSDITIYATC